MNVVYVIVLYAKVNIISYVPSIFGASFKSPVGTA